MDRYSSYGQNDDQPLNDGDSYFLGFYSRYQPTYLEAGQAFYAGNMRMDKGTCQVRKGLLALSNDINLTNPPLIVGATTLALSVAVTSITRSSTTATVTTTAVHGYTTNDRVNISGATQTQYNGDFTITVTDTTHFTYTVSGSPATPATGTILANKGPRKFNSYATQAIGSCVYADTTTNTEGIIIATTQSAYLYRYGQSTITLAYPSPEVVTVGQPFDLVQFLNKVYMFRGYSIADVAPLAVSGISRTSGTATVTTSANHGLASNSWVVIAGADQYDYNIVAQITVTGATTFTYTVANAPVTPATGTMTARPVQPVMSWDGNTSTAAFVVAPTGSNGAGAPLIDIPPADWGVFFKSRFVLPYSRDQLILSDIDDAGTFDPSQNQFRLLPGTNDWLVAAFPYQDGRLLALYRKSVHAILLDSTTLAIAQAFEITRNFGCVARRTVANCGPFIAWLSDIGVVKMDISNELSLTNSAAPLSDPINDLIGTINWTYADSAVGTFWNNRYYIAVPTGTSTINNTVFVYNFLNSAWESVDTFPAGYDVLNFHVMSYGGTERIHTTSTLGYVYLFEQGQVDQWGAPGAVMNFPIPGSLKTRNYLAGTYDLKKVRRFQLDANVTTADAFTVNYVLSNPDATLQTINYTAAATTDITLRSPVNRRGVSGRLEITSSAGRPEFKAVTAESTVSSRATLNYS